MGKIAIVIQCKDNSVRYKEKSVRPFYKDKSILELLFDRFKHLPYHIIVATTPESMKTIKICEEKDMDYITSAEGNVLGQMCEIVETYDLDGIYRICADNPFVQLPLMGALSLWHGYDYVSFKNAMKRHEGFFCEYVSREALRQADIELGADNKMRTNVTEWIYESGWYNVKWLPIPEELNKFAIRLTVDTKDDFRLAQIVYTALEEKHWHYIVDYLYYRPHLIRIMEKNIKENEK